MRQVAALPYRFASGPQGPVEVLLITSFRSRRWIIPKGNVDGGMAPHLAAAQEAEEEGGVRGRIGTRPIGSYRYEKLRDEGSKLLDVDVYPLEVRDELSSWPEQHLRRRRWLPIEVAAARVQEPELEAILRSFRPQGATRRADGE